MLDVLSAACSIAMCHHEKWDGSGYHGLAADQIPPLARLVSVVDVLDALVSVRPYKSGWKIGEVFGYLKKQSGIQFDATVGSALLAHENEVMAVYR